jgi:hypothetical protein
VNRRTPGTIAAQSSNWDKCKSPLVKVQRGFAICRDSLPDELMTPTGFDTLNINTGRNCSLRQRQTKDSAKSNAILAKTAPADPDLARVVEAWPRLSEQARHSVMDLIEGV